MFKSQVFSLCFRSLQNLENFFSMDKQYNVFIYLRSTNKYMLQKILHRKSKILNQAFQLLYILTKLYIITFWERCRERTYVMYIKNIFISY